LRKEPDNPPNIRADRKASSLGYKPPTPEAWMTTTRGMEKWKPLRASHFSMPPTATI